MKILGFGLLLAGVVISYFSWKAASEINDVWWFEDYDEDELFNEKAMLGVMGLVVGAFMLVAGVTLAIWILLNGS